MTPLERDCYRVIAYFAIFHYPVTAFEVWKWLYAPAQAWTLGEVMTCLASSDALQRRVRERNGFYGIDDIDADVRDRHTRYLDAMRKYQRLMWVVQYMGRLPYVEGIAICNSLAFHHTNAESDIDVYIVTRPRRVWTVRLLTVSAMALLRLRPGEAKRDPVCCSFFVDHDLLQLEGLKHAADDPYLAMWHVMLAPLVDYAGIFAQSRAENAWTTALVPNAAATRRAPAFRLRMRRQIPFLPISEAFARTFQERRLSQAIERLKNLDTRVIVNNKMLKFHENDRRAAIATALAKRMANL